MLTRRSSEAVCLPETITDYQQVLQQVAHRLSNGIAEGSSNKQQATVASS